MDLNYGDMEQEQMEIALCRFTEETKKSSFYHVGELYYDRMTERFCINGGELHCGDCFDVLLDGRWVPARLEKNKDWYLVGVPKYLENIPNVTIICREYLN